MGIYDFKGYREADGVLPRHPTTAEVVAEALPALTPPSRITVDEAAANWRMTRVGLSWLNWDNAAAPYMIEPQRMVTSRRYAVVCFVGPAQSLKTSALIENPIAHAITCQPRPVHVVQMDRNAAREFSIEKVGPMIRRSPELQARQAVGKGADNTFDKVFRGGMRLSIGWPVVSQLSSRAIPLMLLTDYDRMPEDVEGEGSPLALARNRPKTFGSLGKVVLEGSPGRPIEREDYTPEGPHSAPPTTGILEVYEGGTRARWYWSCLDCGGEFEPRLDRLEWPEETASPAEAGRRTVMVCPHCGSVIAPGRKVELNARGRWLHETRSGEIAPLGDETRESDVVSYWLQGPAAALSTWADQVTQYLQARRVTDAGGDDSGLKTVLNTQFAMPHLPRAMRDDSGLEAAKLRDMAEPRPLGVAPASARFVTVAVDIQDNRFVVQVDAWGPDLERWLIDRFDLFTPPDDAPGAGGRALDPARYAEDWQVLEPLLDRAWPVEGGEWALRPVAVAYDSGGKPGVTENAYRFWRARRKDGRGKEWRPVRPRGGANLPDRAWIERPKRGHGGKKAASDVPLLYVATDRLKDAVSAQLTRTEPGVAAYHLPATLPTEVFEEFAAEKRTAKGWEKKPGAQRNEALDLAGYALGLALTLGAEKIDWTRPPAWAAEPRFNGRAVDLSAVSGRDEPPAPAAPAPRQPTATKPARKAPAQRGGISIPLRRDWI